jgi:hypothetical protein
MFAKTRCAFLMVAVGALAACNGTPLFGPKFTVEPSPDEMRAALVALLKERPDISIPEFETALQKDPAVVRQGIVYIGAWNCDPKLMTFEALFSSPNITMYEVAGRFQLDARGLWRAIPRKVLTTTKRDIGEFWRASEVEPY